VDFMCERWDLSRGFSIDWSRNKIYLKITKKPRVLNTKQWVISAQRNLLLAQPIGGVPGN
jgi:hypothetical protein